MMRKEQFLDQKVFNVRDEEELTIKDVENPDKIRELKIKFETGKSFILYLAFKNGIIQFKNKELEKEISNEIKQYDLEQEKLEAEQAEINKSAMEVAIKRAEAEAQKRATLPRRGRNSVHRTESRIDKKNIAYKATYCDGNGNWFTSPCSENCREHNCLRSSRAEFCKTNSLCKKVMDGLASENDILNAWKTNFLCYESKLFVDYTIYAGRHNDNRPINWKLDNDRLVILTTVFPGDDERERVIFGAMLINRSIKKDGDKESCATSYPECRIALTPEEAKTMKYWDYAPGEGGNKNLIQWNEKLWRYQTDATCATVLKDLVEVIDKRNNKQESLYAHNFLTKFLELIHMNENDVPEKSGAATK